MGTTPRTTTTRPTQVLLRCVGLACGVLLSLFAGFLGALPASAAAGGLVLSDPETREQTADAPGAVTLVFEGRVDRSVAKVLVLDGAGRNVTDGPIVVEGTNVSTQLEDDLPEGTYTVHYRVDGSGGEPRGGAFQFSYGAGTFVDPPDRSWSGSAAEPEILRGDDPNGPEEPTSTDSPGVEVTSSETPDRATVTSDPSGTGDPADPGGTDDPGTDSTDAGQAPATSVTAGATPADDSDVGRAFLVGGIVLLAAVGGVSYGVYRSRRSASHD